MREWRARSIEEANLLNPAFLGVIIRQSVLGYMEVSNEGAPYPIPFLVAPLILHKETRKNLPKMLSTKFATWITRQEGSKAKLGFGKRARGLSPYITESILFLAQKNLISVSEKSGLLTAVKLNVQLDSDSEEVKACFKASLFGGKWLADAGKIETTMALLGVKP